MIINTKLHYMLSILTEDTGMSYYKSVSLMPFNSYKAMGSI